MLKRTCHPYYSEANKGLENSARELTSQGRLDQAKKARDVSDNLKRRTGRRTRSTSDGVPTGGGR